MTKYNTPTKRNDDVIISALEAGILYLPHNVLIPCDKYGIQKDGYTWLFYKEGKLKSFPLVNIWNTRNNTNKGGEK